MPAYVAFLRAINLGRNRKVPMADLRACLTESGLEDVQTHIQTGNVGFRTSMRSAAKVEQHLETTLASRFGFDIPSIVFTPRQLTQVYDDATGSKPAREDLRGDAQYVLLFKQADVPKGADADAIEAWDAPGEAGLVRGRAVHVWIDTTSQNARIFHAFKKQLDAGTNRNLRVLAATVEKWCA